MADMTFDKSKYFTILNETPINYFKFGVLCGENASIDRYIINKNATIIFWSDNTKTISKRHEEDEFDKELGFLHAYFYKRYKGNNSSRKRLMKTIIESEMKNFLLEFYIVDSGKTRENAKKYLQNLVVNK